jgi:MATE family multidrug resistance protein
VASRSIFGPLVRLASPIALAQVALIAISLADVAIIGHASVTDLAGAAMGHTLGYATSTLTMGVAMSLEPLASQALGASNPRRASAALDATVRALLVTWPAGTAVAFLVGALLPRFGVEPEVAAKTREYLIGQTPGFYFYGLFYTHKTFLQAHGSTRPALVAVGIANAVNLAVCSVLVRGDAALRAVHLPAVGLPPLGALGAGMASSIAFFTLSMIVRAASLRVRMPGVARVERATPVSDHVGVGVVMRLGVPVGGVILAEAGVFTCAALIAGSLGKEVVSAHQIGMGLSSFTYMGAMGISGATAVLVGRAVGAGETPRRTGLLGIAFGGGIMAAPAIAFTLFPRELASLFTGDAGVIDRAVVLLRIAAVFQLFDGTQAVAVGALRGAGDVRAPLIVNLVAYWVIGLPLGLVLCFALGRGAPGLWWGLTLGLVVAAAFLTLRFARLSSRPIAALNAQQQSDGVAS